MNLRYKKLEVIGQGAFGVVHKAKDTETNEIVALKKIRIGNAEDGVNISAIREIKFLKELNHPNVVKLLNVFHHSQNINIVYEHCKKDLEKVIKDREIMFSPSDIKSLMQMLLEGLNHCHQNWIIHRDMKPSNILLNGNCSLKICDFGLARFTDNEDNMLTEYVATRWFRAPEIILSWKEYTKAIDVWSVGCIFAEILGRKTLFPGRNYIHQIELIVELIGTPSVEEIDTFQNEAAKEYMMKVPKKQKQPFSKLYTNADPLALDLLDKMLTFNPDKRITVDEALKHPYLESHYDPDEATECTEKFDFSFENSELSTEELRKLIYEEIIDFHTEKK
eukprot:Anaeramoba_ignava/a479814_110.p2 GENE.a479814_110~~a479814_110.p2  ORF type:complete len:335 (-),score=94.66 a479814_110:219-1223(-)